MKNETKHPKNKKHQERSVGRDKRNEGDRGTD